MDVRPLESPLTGMERSSCSYLRRLIVRLPGKEVGKGEESNREGEVTLSEFLLLWQRQEKLLEKNAKHFHQS